MKKKVLTILGSIIILLLIIYGIIFFVDYNNVSNGKLPIFVIKSDMENYKGLGYTVKVKYYKDTKNIETIDMYAFGKTVAGVIIDYYDENINTSSDIIIIEKYKMKIY